MQVKVGENWILAQTLANEVESGKKESKKTGSLETESPQSYLSV